MSQALFTYKYCEIHLFGLCNYVRHLKLYHESKDGFLVECNFDGCKSYNKIKSFDKH